MLWRGRALVAALCAGSAVAVALPLLTPAPAPTEAVVVLARDVGISHRITAADLAIAEVPAVLAPAGTMTSPEHAVGSVTAIALAEGSLVPPTALIGAGHEGAQAPAGRVTVPVRLADSAVAALLDPGDRVDLVAVVPESPQAAQVIAPNAIVLARLTGGSSPEGVLGGAGADAAPLLLLAVEPAFATLVLGASAGSSLTAVLVDLSPGLDRGVS